MRNDQNKKKDAVQLSRIFIIPSGLCDLMISVSEIKVSLWFYVKLLKLIFCFLLN